MTNAIDPSSKRRFVPGLAVLRGYERAWLRTDLLAGVTVAAYLIPQVMAYAVIAGLEPVVGLYAFIGPTLVYVLFGSSRQLSVGPESTTALMTAVAVVALGATSGTTEYAALCAALAIAVGVMCVAGWLFRLGFLADLLSKPVLIGYMTGVAGLMVISQIKKLTGIATEGDSLMAQVASAWRNRADLHLPTLGLAAVLLVLLFVGAKLLPKSPNPLIVVLLGTAAVAFLGLERYGIKVIGEVPAGLPLPALPLISWDQIVPMLVPALGIAVVGYSDNVLTARAFAARSGNEDIDANQEFLALGTANLASGFMQGFPVSSSGSRTAIGASLGSRSQVYSLVALLTVVLTVFFLGGVLAAFPTAALGALVVYAAWRLVDVPEWVRLWKFRWSEFALAAATTIAVLTVDVLNGILVAIGLSLADLLRRVARPHAAVQGYVPGISGMHDIEDYPEVHQVPGLVVFRYDSPLFFANADDFRHRAEWALSTAEAGTRWLLVNAEAIVQVDLTSLDAIEELRAELASRDIRLAVARAKQELVEEFDRVGLLDRIGRAYVFPTLPTAVRAYLMDFEEEFGSLPEGIEIPKLPSDALTHTDD